MIKKDNRSKNSVRANTKISKSKSTKVSKQTKSKKNTTLAATIVTFVLVIAIVIGAVIGTRPKNDLGLSKEPPQILDSATITDDRPTPKDTILLNPIEDVDESYGEIYEQEYTSTTAIGYSSENIGIVKRYRPVEEVKDDREYFPLGIEVAEDARYPKYGYTMSSVVGSDPDGLKANARTKLIQESSYLTATGTANAGGGGYSWMDKDGYLYSGVRHEDESLNTPAYYPNTTIHRQLYKHTAAEGLYLGDVSDDEPGIVKDVIMRPRGYTSYGVTGVYAPAGEVIKIEMTEKDMVATGGIVIHIGQALYNGQANNIWTEKGQMQRIPHLLNTMVVTKSTAYFDENTQMWTAYVGSFIGGPLYIRNEGVTFTTRISGGVTYQHFILGYTTAEEFAKNSTSTAPYFDLEVWQYGVLHSGPLHFAKPFSYDDIYKAAVLWEKVSSVTTTGSSQGIVFLYDPFVAAGAAVAFPGRSSVNCPMGWMSSSLNYNGIVTSGAWGNFHEYHHNFQGYGVGNGGEVTNNGLNLVSYALFTKISSNRGIGAFGAQGLGGWNSYTSATWALEEVLKIARPDENPSNGNQGLSLYATLLHNFGADKYMQAKVQGGGQSYAAYMNAWQKVTHNNMYYYFNNILQGTGISNNADSSYPMFVPVSCVYQTGRSYMYDGVKQYFKTMQPFLIPNEDYNIDLSKYSAPSGQYASGSIVIPDGFTYRIKNITKPKNGSIEIIDNFNFKYSPLANAKTGDTSGQIIVTLEIVKNDKAFKVEDVDLVLEFEISQEKNKMTLERTTYTYSSDNMYADAQVAFEAGFANYSSVESYAHTNPVQNANTDIWFYPDNQANRESHPDSPEHHFIHDNKIDVIDGKLHFDTDGKYRVYLRGRLNCAVYYSLDGEHYSIGATIKDTTAPSNSANFRLNDSNTYFDVEFKDGICTVYVGGAMVTRETVSGERWLYTKEVLILQSSPSISYIGLGVGTWSDPLYRMVDKFYDAEGNEVDSIDDENYDHSVTIYYDNAGNEVSEDIVIAAEKVPPTTASYVNAYRRDYNFPNNSEFESDYFYIRSYNYNYVGETESLTEGKFDEMTYMSKISNYRPWGDDNELLNIGNLFDGDTSTNVHTYNNFFVTPNTPLIIAFDMGKVVKANSLSLSVYTGNNLGYRAFPKELLLEGSLDGEEWYQMGYWSTLDSSYSGKELTFPDKEFKYFKITVTKSNHDASSRFALSELNLSYTERLTGNGSNHIAPTNEHIVYTGNWETVHDASSFGSVLVGESGSRILMEFKGTRLAILTPLIQDNHFEVYIDGVLVSNVNNANPSGYFGITYLSEHLENGTHKLEIRCTGKTYFDSFAIYNEV